VSPPAGSRQQSGRQLDRTVVITLGNPRSSNGFAGVSSPVIGTPGATA
jgi:hypothetical protein